MTQCFLSDAILNPDLYVLSDSRCASRIYLAGFVTTVTTCHYSSCRHCCQLYPVLSQVPSLEPSCLPFPEGRQRAGLRAFWIGIKVQRTSQRKRRRMSTTCSEKEPYGAALEQSTAQRLSTCSSFLPPPIQSSVSGLRNPTPHTPTLNPQPSTLNPPPSSISAAETYRNPHHKCDDLDDSH